jgi:spore coat polysaccharide biosynthesis predicted glycosyltransferase SpsG
LFDWQADSRTRQHFRNPEPPDWDSHVKWLTNKLADTKCIFAVIEYGAALAGVIRLDWKTEPRPGYEISILIAPALHGRGIGRTALALAPNLAANAEITATVLCQNKASHALFAGAGYKPSTGNTGGRGGKIYALPAGETLTPARVLLCPDGGAGIGLGHFTRITELSVALARRGVQVRIAIAEKSGLQEIVSNTQLPWNIFDGSASGLAELAIRSASDLVVLDHKQIDPAEMVQAIGTRKRLVAFSDNPRARPQAAALIDASPATADQTELRPTDSLLLFGPTYQIIRRDTPRGDPIARRSPPARLLVTLGGSTAGQTLSELVTWLEDRFLQRWKNVSIDLVIGPFAGAALRTSARIDVHVAPPSLAPLMAEADLAISGGGQTLFELAYAAVPTVALEGGTDQRPNLDSLEERQCLVRGGIIGDPDWTARLETVLNGLMESSEVRVEMATKAAAMVDGWGGDRIAGAIAILARQARLAAPIRSPDSADGKK